MLILKLTSPTGAVKYITAAFPSACGKTNLAMLVPTLKDEFRVFTVGDDICWMHFGEDGRLWAINPEAGFFGVAPGTGKRTNSNALASLGKNSIFTNVAVTPTGEPWWEGLTPQPPAGLTDWQGRPWSPELAEKNGKAAHPNSRFTAPARQCPSISPEFDAPQGVPISAIIFGGRRARLAPLVMEARDWEHGVYLGATMASETTAAATGAVGVVRNDPMAMLPFCGYNMGDYFGHWLKMGKRTSADKLPKVFHVNWFRVDEEGKFLWPGYGDNIRVLSWIIDRVSGDAAARETPIGHIPTPSCLDLKGLKLADGAIDKLLAVDVAGWREEADRHREFFTKFGPHLPAELWQQHDLLTKKLS
jgi:phosphoenolpyruvate carboxykinase (GTP)